MHYYFFTLRNLSSASKIGGLNTILITAKNANIAFNSATRVCEDMYTEDKEDGFGYIIEDMRRVE